jgi:hypothetical protein
MDRRINANAVLLPLVLLLIVGCRELQQQTWTRTELCFGLGKPDHSVLTDEQWQTFVNEQIVPRFPQGFTVVPAEGRWFQDGQTRSEPSRIVIIMHPMNSEDDQEIDSIAQEYARRFNQDAVLRADGPSRVRFVEK